MEMHDKNHKIGTKYRFVQICDQKDKFVHFYEGNTVPDNLKPKISYYIYYFHYTIHCAIYDILFFQKQ